MATGVTATRLPIWRNRLLQLAAALSVGVTLAGPAPSAFGASFTASSTVDEPDANRSDGLCLTAAGECTLRAAVQQANALSPGPHTIVLLGGATYTLTMPGGGVLTDANGELDVNADLSIVTTGASAVVQGASGWRDRILLVQSGKSAELVGVRLEGGYFGGAAGGGGGILNFGTLTLRNSVVSGNRVERAIPGLGDIGGGGILSTGTLTLTESTVSGNTAGSSFGGGAGIWNLGTLTISGSTVSGNRSAGRGGGVWNAGTATLTSTTVSGNSSESLWGGGIDNSRATMTVTSSTVSANNAVIGGGIGNASATLALTSTLATGNNAVNGGGGILNFTPGNDASAALTVTNTAVRGNTAGEFGGGIANSGLNTLAVTNSIVSGNSSGGSGGGIQCGRATVTNTTISGNSAGRSGGGLYTCSTQTLTNSTVSGNSAGSDGGGFFVSSGASITLGNSTISANRAAQSGGAIRGAAGPSGLNNVTIARNVADSDADGTGDGGGIFGAVLHVANTIVADNVDASPTVEYPDCLGSLNSDGFNLVENTTGCTISGDTSGNITARDPQLAALRDNGGPTLTQALVTRTVVTGSSIFELPSPAVDAGAPDKGTRCLDADQRGKLRPVDGNADRSARCDIGAYEAGPTPSKLGAWSLARTKARVLHGKRVAYRLTWTVPSRRRWRSLDTLHVRFLDRERTALWARFKEVSGSLGVFSVVNPRNGKPGTRFVPGHPKRLQGEAAMLYLAETSVDGPPGRRLTLTLSLSFKRRAAGHVYSILVAATGDAGEVQGFHRAGTVAVS